MSAKEDKAPLIQRALISVSNKNGLIPLAQALKAHGTHLLSTGGTAKTLCEAGMEVQDIADYTGFPEIMGGRVKTLHPLIHGAILARRDQDAAVMREHGIMPIDMVVVNLYPFEDATAKQDCSFADGIEHIDIGGVTLMRAAAKNHSSVLVVVSPDDYDSIAEALREGTIDPKLRQQLARKAFAHTSAYDAAISSWLHSPATADTEASDSLFPKHLNLRLNRSAMLRYGENPHQRAALYTTAQHAAHGIATSQQIQGRELSFNNIADTDAAWECVCAFDQPACVIVKHANPCGVALGKTLTEAYQSAYRADPTSAFGGIIAFNQKVDAALVKLILKQQFVEVLIAPDYEYDVSSVIATKPAMRVLRTDKSQRPTEATQHYKQILGGMLVQQYDGGSQLQSSMKAVSKRQPTPAELRDLQFAWTVARYVKSNAIIYAKDEATSGIGAGQMNRAMSVRIAGIAAEKHERPLKGAVMASDAFFPFRDGIDLAAEHGIAAIIQPGGSKNDAQVIQAADEHGMAMVFTAMRHFRH